MSTPLKLVLGVALAFALPAVAVTPSTPDSLITSKTKLSLWTTAGVRSTTVHVDTTEGVVSLYGKVPTAAQRTLAEEATLGVSGVKSVRNLLQVVTVAEEKATAHSDQEVKERVTQELAALKDSTISVKSVDKGVVLLTGQAHSYGDYLRALASTYRVAGVQRIVTEVKTPGDFREDERVTFFADTKRAVDAKAADMRGSASDLAITTDVKMRLWTSPQVPSTEISVDTDDGVVTLFGLVPTSAMKNAAGAEAAKALDVRMVDNQLEVVPVAARKAVDASDADVNAAVQLAFKDWSALAGVSSSVKNGIVRLTGTVPTGWDQLSAVRLARHVNGARGVENQLKVDDSAWSRRY